MTTIRQLLREKGDKVISVRPADLVYDAIRKMAEENINSLVVMEGETLKGIVTERQYARHVAMKGPVIARDPRPEHYGDDDPLCAARAIRGRMYGGYDE
jgi:CBS domain-containing protein